MLLKEFRGFGQNSFHRNQISELQFDNLSKINTIAGDAFMSNSITNLDLSNLEFLELIDTKVFYNNRITSVSFPNNLSRISTYAFYGNYLSDILIPKNIEKIDSNAFDNQHSSLKIINIEKDEESWNGDVLLGSNWYDKTLNPSFNYNYVKPSS